MTTNYDLDHTSSNLIIPTNDEDIISNKEEQQ